MTTRNEPKILPTVSRAFLEDWLTTLHAHCTPAQLAEFLDRTGLSEPAHPKARATHDQIVRLYQLVAVETGDEMMGLWSRPIRSGALKHLCASVRGASSMSAALFRFTTFWNLLLDDFFLSLENDARRVVISPREDAAAHRFGHMLLLKLAHGVASWLAGSEVRVRRVDFAFAQPSFAEDYAVLFPAHVRFSQTVSAIEFESDLATLPASRSEAEMQDFLVRAPRDWIFTSYREHALPLRTRELILRSDRLSCRLSEAAAALNMTPRTLIRRLSADGTSFQAIKDGVRRDIALRELSRSRTSVEAVSQDLGFASAANFHRAFKRWTNMTPGAYRSR